MTKPTGDMSLDAIHHVAITTPDTDEAVDWYIKTFHCTIDYQDETWALLNFANIQLALVAPHQHPAHIAFVNSEADQYGSVVAHRDGSRSVYTTDPFSNAIEMMAEE
jgi:catechol 2,3-dioxygenase-like lactoylglutathione lyase family enzyme